MMPLRKKLNKGDILLFAAFGGGFTWGSMLQMGVNFQNFAFLCPGASQKIGMCKDLYEKDGFARSNIDKASDILDCDIKSIMFNGPDEVLKQTIYTQPAMFISSYIIGSLLMSNGLKPTCAAGHSLGNFLHLL